MRPEGSPIFNRKPHSIAPNKPKVNWIATATDGAKGAAELIPAVGQAVAVGSVFWDIGSTIYEYGGCKGWWSGG